MHSKSSHHHQHHPHQYSEKQEDVKWCCCPLHSLVTSISVLLISIYLVSITVSTIIWVLHSETKDLTAGTVVEVEINESFSRVYLDKLNFESLFLNC